MIWRLVAIFAGIFSLYASGYCFKKALDGEAIFFDWNVMLGLCFIAEACMSILIAVSI